MERVTMSRKERIMKERFKTANERSRKVGKYVLAGTIASSIMLSTNTKTVLGCNLTTYVVQKGDTLYSLAKKYGVSIEQIQGANGLESELIKIGQILDVPSEVMSIDKIHVKKQKQNNIKKEVNMTCTVERGDTLYSLANKNNVSVEQIKNKNRLTSDMIIVGQKLEIPFTEVNNSNKQSEENNTSEVTHALYTVAPGDSLWSIAKQFHTTVSDIKLYNNLRTDTILIDQKLVIKQTNLIKTTATVVGAADNFSVEFTINGNPKVLKVAYGTGSSYGRLSGKKVEIVYHNSDHPTLVSYKLIK